MTPIKAAVASLDLAKLRRIGMFILIFAYPAAVVLSVVTAHVAAVVAPQSGLWERLMAPVARTLEFMDIHWKAAVMLAAPILVPVGMHLIPRLRKAGALEFDPAGPKGTGAKEKPPQRTP